VVWVAVHEADDLKPARLGILLDAQLLQRVEGVAVPGSVRDRVAHGVELDHPIIVVQRPADQRATGFVGVARLQVGTDLSHDGLRDMQAHARVVPPAAYLRR
jgi:hypothetical protein